MPEKKVNVTYLCEICSDEHGSRSGALDCEKKGVAIPEFNNHEVVKLFGLSTAVVKNLSGHRVIIEDGLKGVVHSIGGDSDSKFNPHLLPAYYEIWIPTLAERHKKELITVSRVHLRKTIVNDNVLCPLCGASRVETVATLYNPFLLGMDGAFLFRNIPTRKCSNCATEFFTTKQLRKIGSLVKKNIKWPLADTRRLVREHQFQY